MREIAFCFTFCVFWPGPCRAGNSNINGDEHAQAPNTHIPQPYSSRVREDPTTRRTDANAPTPVPGTIHGLKRVGAGAGT